MDFGVICDEIQDILLIIEGQGIVGHFLFVPMLSWCESIFPEMFHEMAKFLPAYIMYVLSHIVSDLLSIQPVLAPYLLPLSFDTMLCVVCH